MRNGDVVC